MAFYSDRMRRPAPWHGSRRTSTPRIAQIRRTVLTLALPVTVSSLLQRTEGIADIFLVGGLGAVSIAAVGLGQLLAFIATTLVSGLSVGATVVIAQLCGAK